MNWNHMDPSFRWDDEGELGMAKKRVGMTKGELE